MVTLIQIEYLFEFFISDQLEGSNHLCWQDNFFFMGLFM